MVARELFQRIAISALLAVLICSAEAAAQEPCAIVVGRQASPLEQDAGRELQRYLQKLFGFRPLLVKSTITTAASLILVGSPQSNPAVKVALGDDWPQLSDQGFALRKVKAGGKPALVVGGGSPVATLWAAYALLEKYGVRFLILGDFLPEKRLAFTLPDVEVVQEPVATFRSWNVWLLHPFAAESWGLQETKRVVDQLVKMRYNVVHLLLTQNQPIARFEYRGVRNESADFFSGWKFPIGGDDIGKEQFGGAREFTNPDFAQVRTYEERVAVGQKLLNGVIDYAHQRGMKVLILFPLMHFPGDFVEQFENWLPPSMIRESETTSRLDVLGNFIMGADKGGAAFLNPDNPALLDLVEYMVKTIIDTYPRADFFCLWNTEYRWSVGGYERAWQALDRKFGVEKIRPLRQILADARRPFQVLWKDRAEREVKGDIELLYFLDKLLTERRVLTKTKRPDLQLLVGGAKRKNCTPL